MENPFELINRRLSNLENLLLDLKHTTLPSLLENKGNSKMTIVDLDGLIKARPMVGSRSTVYKKAANGIIPHSKRGKKLLFDLNVIDEWLLENRIKSPAEIADEVQKYMKSKNKKRGQNAPK